MVACSYSAVAMAEKEALKKVEDQLNCPVCRDVYVSPKTLQCLHVFCQACLERLVFQDEQGPPVLSCPNCRRITPVPASGVAGLQPAFLINDLLDITGELRREQEPATAEQAGSSSASSLPPAQEGVSYCSEHTREELKLYCETCGTLVCEQCTMKAGQHYSHDCALIEPAFETYKNEIAPLLESVNKQATCIDEILFQLEKGGGEVSDQQAAIEADIHDTINRLHQVLDIRKTELIARLHQVTQRKQKDLAAQKDQAETIRAQLSSCQDYMKQSIETDRLDEALKMKTTVLKQVKELTTTVQPDALRPNTKANITFSASDNNTTALCRHVGQILSGSPDPSNCRATDESLEVGFVGQTSTVALQTFNTEGEPCAEPVTSLECKLVSDLTNVEVTGSCKELKELNQYEISYQPTIKGRHHLHISIQGQPIRESPFCIAVTSSITTLGAPIHTITKLNKPWGIAINQEGEMVVTERFIGQMSTFTPNGKKIQTIDLKGLRLLGLTLDRDGNILVADDTSNCIRRYSPEGQLLVSAGKGGGRLPFNCPDGIAVNPINNRMYVTDSSNHRLQVLNSDLTFSATFGEYGSNVGQFSCPSGIACDGAGNVYVADSANNRVQVFTAEGEFLRTIGRQGSGKGELDWPVGVALDSSSTHVYVSDSKNHRIVVFTPEGRFVTSFGADVENFVPYGLAVDNCGVVHVCDCGNNTIQMF